MSYLQQEDALMSWLYHAGTPVILFWTAGQQVRTPINPCRTPRAKQLILRMTLNLSMRESSESPIYQSKSVQFQNDGKIWKYIKKMPFKFPRGPVRYYNQKKPSLKKYFYKLYTRKDIGTVWASAPGRWKKDKIYSQSTASCLKNEKKCRSNSKNTQLEWKKKSKSLLWTNDSPVMRLKRSCSMYTSMKPWNVRVEVVLIEICEGNG